MFWFGDLVAPLEVLSESVLERVHVDVKASFGLQDRLAEILCAIEQRPRRWGEWTHANNKLIMRVA